MNRRTALTVLAGLPLIVLFAACGSDTDEPAVGEELPTATADPGTDPPASGEATGSTTPDAPPTEPASTEPASSEPTSTEPTADETDPEAAPDATPVLEFGYYGGFTTPEVAFQMVPLVYVTDDGRVISGGVETMMFPGALVPNHTVRTITGAGIDELLTAADEAGLLADIEYARNDQIADAATATLRITADGTTYEHSAYALGIGGPPLGGEESDPQRQALADFVTRLEDLASLVGADELGEEEPYEPTGYQMVTFPVDDVSGFEVEPTILDWPVDTGIVLADVDGCVEVEREAVGDLFTDADQLTFFAEDGATWSLAVRPVLPGRDCPA